MNTRLRYNILALLTVAIWGVTFVSTKILLGAGLTPVMIFIIRFAIAYLCALALSHRRIWADSFKDEMAMLAMGLTGGSLYFIAENSALELTFASNVSLIICATPVLTMVLDALIYRHRIGIRAATGSLLAMSGVAIVVLNGSLNFHLNPLGDFLTFLAALSWAVYCMLLKAFNHRYDNLFITRKVFFYGLATAVLLSVMKGPLPSVIATASLFPVVFNLLFLGLVASFLCYLSWNKAVKELGPDRTANYIYLTPLITIAASSIILGEPVTVWLIVGGAIIIGGVYLTTERHADS